MALTLVTAPSVEPISLAEAKLHLRVDVSDDDDLISGLIQAARELAEETTRRALITQTWKYIVDEFPEEDYMELPLPPLQSVTSVIYKDQDGTEATFSSGSYIVNTDDEPGKVVLGYGESWPSTTLYPTGAVITQFKAGYGATAATVPQAIIQGMMLLLGHWYENREAVVQTGAIPKELPLGITMLWWPYRVLRWV